MFKALLKALRGPAGQLGKPGDSAYDIFKKHYPESTLTEKEWVDSLNQPPTVKQFVARWITETWNQLSEDEQGELRASYKLGGATLGETLGSAGIDLRAITIQTQDYDDIFSRSNTYELLPGEIIKVHTGLSIWLNDPNCAGLILPRSGLGSKHGIVLGNLVGLIDSDYQGELIVTLWNRSNEPFTLTKGDRIAQYLVIPRFQFSLIFNDDFSERTQRGEGGFGSTGIQ